MLWKVLFLAHAIVFYPAIAIAATAGMLSVITVTCGAGCLATDPAALAHDPTGDLLFIGLIAACVAGAARVFLILIGPRPEE